MREQIDSFNKENTKNYNNLSQDVRKIRGFSILAKGDVPVIIDDENFFVPSQSNEGIKYKVTHIEGWECECPDFKHRKVVCKHISAIQIFLKLRNSQDIDASALLEDVSADVEGRCPSCNSGNLIKRGIRKTTSGDKQRFSCKDCKVRFVLSPIKNIKGNAKYVCLALDCYYKGLSYRDIADQFKQFYGLELHHETIRRWVLNYGKLMEKYSRQLQPKTSGIWNGDETMIKTKKAENDYEYLWNVVDNKTKFLLASVNSEKGRSKDDAEAVMREALKQNKETPDTIITDKLASYQDGIRRTFKNWGEHRKVKHISILGKRKQINNNVAENHQAHQKEFHKVRRGVNHVQDYADGFKVFHNYVIKGVKDKQTPADRCGIGIEGNRWETLLLKSLKEVPQATPKQERVKSPSR